MGEDDHLSALAAEPAVAVLGDVADHVLNVSGVDGPSRS